MSRKSMISVRFSPKEAEQVRARANEEFLSLSAFIRRAVRRRIHTADALVRDAGDPPPQIEWDQLSPDERRALCVVGLSRAAELAAPNATRPTPRERRWQMLLDHCCAFPKSTETGEG